MTNIKKIIANKIAISFFISSIIILMIYVFLFNKISYYTSIINTTAININKKNTITKYDKENKRLIGYPTYGEKYADLLVNTIDLNLPIYHGDSLTILKSGVGHYAGSYFPGEGGTVILAAHNTKGFFNRFEEIQLDDIVTISANYGTFKYKVYDTKIVNETDLDAFKIQDKEERLIMYTCYPINKSIIGRKTKRYVVYAKLVGENYE